MQDSPSSWYSWRVFFSPTLKPSVLLAVRSSSWWSAIADVDSERGTGREDLMREEMDQWTVFSNTNGEIDRNRMGKDERGEEEEKRRKTRHTPWDLSPEYLVGVVERRWEDDEGRGYFGRSLVAYMSCGAGRLFFSTICDFIFTSSTVEWKLP